MILFAIAEFFSTFIIDFLLHLYLDKILMSYRKNFTQLVLGIAGYFIFGYYGIILVNTSMIFVE